MSDTPEQTDGPYRPGSTIVTQNAEPLVVSGRAVMGFDRADVEMESRAPLHGVLGTPQNGLSLWDGAVWISLEDRVRQLVAETLQARVTEALLAMDQEGRDQIRVFMDALAARGL